MIRRVTLDVEAGQVSAELARCGLASGTRVHVFVEVVASASIVLPMTAIAQKRASLDWLADEPDLYTDADLKQ